MVIKKHKPALEGVIRRRSLTIDKYLLDLGVRSTEQLKVVLEALKASYRVSEELEEKAFAWAATLKPPEKKPEKPKSTPKAEEPKAEKEKPKRQPRRSTKRSTTRKKAPTKKETTESEKE